MAAQTQGTPYPYRISLSASLAELPVEKGIDVNARLGKLRGWQTSYIDRLHCCARYTYTHSRMASTLRSARDILKDAGVANPMLTAFIVWRIDFQLRNPLSIVQYEQTADSLCALPNVLRVFPGDGNDRKQISLEVEDEPSRALMRRIKKIVPPEILLSWK